MWGENILQTNLSGRVFNQGYYFFAFTFTFGFIALRKKHSFSQITINEMLMKYKLVLIKAEGLIKAEQSQLGQSFYYPLIRWLKTQQESVTSGLIAFKPKLNCN